MKLFNDRFQFEDLFKDEPSESDVTKDLRAKLASIGANARECLKQERFVEYKKSYEASKGKLLDAMVDYTTTFLKQPQADLNLYAAKMIQFVTRVQALNSLIKTVELDARKGLEEKEADNG